MPTATGAPASARRWARPASSALCCADWQAFSTATGIRCSASSAATCSAGTGSALPSSSVSKYRKPRLPANSDTMPGEKSSRSSRLPCSSSA